MNRFLKYSLIGGAVLGMVFVGWQLTAVRGAFAPMRPVSEATGAAVIAGAAGHRIAGRLFITGTPDPKAPMVVLLHGDAPFGKPRYQYFVASAIAEKVPGTKVVAFLRPGYADPYGGKSDGDRGFAYGENYTREVESDVAAAIRLLKDDWGSPSVVLVGHSGGAAIAANVAALEPGLVQHVFLAGCVCDVPTFRRHMANSQGSPFWLLPVDSLSPLQTIEQMQKDTTITAISGEADPITLPEYAHAYVLKAKAAGIAATMITIPGEGHEIFDNPVVIDSVAAAVRDPS